MGKDFEVLNSDSGVTEGLDGVLESLFQVILSIATLAAGVMGNVSLEFEAHAPVFALLKGINYSL